MQHLSIISFLLFFLIACQVARLEDTAVPTLPVQETATVEAEEPPATSSLPPSSTAAPDPTETAPDLGKEEVVPVPITGLGDPIYPDLGNEGIDVQHYDLDLVVDMEAGTICGSTKIDAVATEPRTWFSLDLAGLEVEAVNVNGDPASYNVEASKLIIFPGLELSQDKSFTAVIQYAGKPQPIPDRSAPIPTEAQDLFGSPVYLRGAYTLHALRQTVGDDIFFQILREYYDRHQGDSASTADFIAVAEELGGQTAVDILNKWLYYDTIRVQN